MTHRNRVPDTNGISAMNGIGRSTNVGFVSQKPRAAPDTKCVRSQLKYRNHVTSVGECLVMFLETGVPQ